MSGGVDSSVSAALLQKDGYDVTGVFIKVWQPDWIECTWREDRRDAMRVCAHLGIPFITLDLEKEYKKEVIDYMISEYSIGRTPNPDVMCNQHVKFGAFYDWAMKQGADYVATGHYSQICKKETLLRKMLRKGEEGKEGKNQRTESLSLCAGTDPNKDQSYFLWTIKNAQLEHILFPVGDIEKPEVRKLAHKFGLPNADKKDSQGLCFIGKIDVKDFLSKYIEQKSGNVLNIKGEIIGTHSGSLLITIGERRGFIITKKTPNDAPYYVISKDTEANTITVTNNNPDSSTTKTTTNASNIVANISNVNWISEIPTVGAKLRARSRYRQPLQNIQITNLNNQNVEIKFETAQDTLTSGQSLVIYDGEVCVGGGIID